MKPDDIEEFLNYFDETQVTIRFVDMPGTPAATVWTADFITEGELNHRDDMVRDLEAALVDANGYSLPHTIDIARRHTDWGASAAFQEIVVEVARFAFEEGADATADAAKLAAGAGMKMLWDRWRNRRRANQDFELLEGLEAAHRAAADRLARAYGIDVDTLTLTSDAHDPDAREWQFTFVSESHEFKVKLTLSGDDVITSEISRSATE